METNKETNLDDKTDFRESASDSDIQVRDAHTPQLKRSLDNRQIQLIAIGGSIGTALFVSIGSGLARAGPLNLLIAYTAYSCLLGLINNCIAEMAILHPVEGSFIRMASHWVDDAFGFMAGWNFFLYEALLIPFEITASMLVLSYWRDDIPAAAVCAICIALYGILNILAVRAYGETEFWLSGGKVILIFMLFGFTFVTMVGGNPQRDAYGFRNWRTPVAEYRSTGDLGRFEAFCAGLWSAAFTIVGPEYVAMISAEARYPRIYIKNAFKTIYWRFGIFFIMGAFCVGTVVPYWDTTLQAIADGTGEGSGTAAASPYVIAMRNLQIEGLPHVVNALLLTSIFSAGNTYTYCATRSLYSLVIESKGPKFLSKVTKSGVPIYCFGVTMLFPLLSFLQVSNNTSQVLTWLTNLITAGALINFIAISTTYIFFYRACMAQGVDRSSFPYTGWFQPYCAYIGLAGECIIVLLYGYSTVEPFSPSGFFTHYAMLIVVPFTYCGWKFIKKTKFVKPLEADLIWDRPITDAYEASETASINTFWREMAGMVGWRMRKKVDVET
ncbi:general amino acid permease-3 [Elsinoe australis]|uniref:General amino acid permease-3 n=1 Tax=Elsinoe australis TaxID=40998 RepID=A0A4U7AVV5_9PEZI|nr:general amino acid permease-3 [Elsinoe australis]